MSLSLLEGAGEGGLLRRVGLSVGESVGEGVGDSVGGGVGILQMTFSVPSQTCTASGSSHSYS